MTVRTDFEAEIASRGFDAVMSERLLELVGLAIQAGAKEMQERCAIIAEGYSNAKPGDICEVMAGDFQAGIADAIRRAPTLME